MYIPSPNFAVLIGSLRCLALIRTRLTIWRSWKDPTQVCKTHTLTRERGEGRGEGRGERGEGRRGEGRGERERGERERERGERGEGRGERGEGRGEGGERWIY